MISMLVGDPHKGQAVDLKGKNQGPSFIQQDGSGWVDKWLVDLLMEGCIHPVTHQAGR